MKVSEITVSNVAEYLRFDDPDNLADAEKSKLEALLTAAKQYIVAYTGIPLSSDNTDIETLDNHEDFYIVVMVLCQDMYDNRSMYVDKSNLNKVVETILGMHCRNFL